MITSIAWQSILNQLEKQLSSLFLIDYNDKALIDNVLWGGVIDSIEYCFSKTPNKYYSQDGQTYFNPYHSAQYTIFLYMMSHAVWKSRNSILADKIYYLNKIMNGLDFFYEIEMPKFFKCDHPVGTVLGRAKYGEGFSFSQNCTVGNNKGIYPIIGENVIMSANSSIIGNCCIGNNVIIGANSGVKDIDIPSNSIVFGHTPNNVIKQKR